MARNIGENSPETWSQQGPVTLLLTPLTDDEIAQGSVLMGGGMARYITVEDPFDFKEVQTIVFEWGDPRIEGAFAALLEHDDANEPLFFPFSATAVDDDGMAWMLDIQDKDFSPERNFPDPSHYVIIPLSKDEGAEALRKVSAMPYPRPERLAKISSRWVAFSIGTKIR